MVTLGYGTGHTFVTHDQHAVRPFSLTILLTLSSRRPPHAHLMLFSCCPPHAVLAPSSSCPPPHAVLLTSSSSHRPLCAVPLASHVAPLTLPSLRCRTVLSCCHCLMLSCHPPRAIHPSSSRHPPHAAVYLVPFPMRCKDDRTAGRTKGVRHTSPGPSKGRGEARYFAPKGTQGKEGVGRKSKAEG